eukprot:g34801.t1
MSIHALVRGATDGAPEGKTTLSRGRGAMDKYEQISIQISGAIELGAPMYNRGDVAGCHRLYAKTYESLLRDPLIICTPSLASILQGQKAQLLPADTAAAHNRNAWTLRHGFDAVLALLHSPRFQATSPAAAAAVATRSHDHSAAEAQAGQAGTGSPTVLLDCTKPDVVRTWYALNDGVMGGVSSGAFSFSDRHHCGLFQGQVRTENFGGFSGVRCPLRTSLEGRRCIVLEVLNGSQEKKTLELLLQDQAAANSGINFRVPFTLPPSTIPSSGDGQAKLNFTRVEIPLSAFDGRGSWRGRPLPTQTLRWSAIQCVGFMILKPHVGAFQLLVKSIAVL